MCGFAGEYLFGRPPSTKADLGVARDMASVLAHRGPDDEQAWLSPDGRCAIGFRRLAVIDPARSRQPMTSADGALTVAFNGEIYNFRELRRRLSDEGARFTTDGDTEVLLHLYAADGPQLVHHLEGMFAFVLYDAAAGRLLLARDRLGQKPLWYTLLPDRLVFASESPALLRHPAVHPTLDRSAIALYFTMGYIPCPRSAWRGVRKLPPACCLIATTDAPEPEPYWQLRPEPLPPAAPDQLALVRDTFTAAVRRRLLADVPLGALLSGGVDSALVVALMARAAGRTGGVRTFTAGFADPAYDERPAARRIADHLGTDHTELLVEPQPAESLDALVAMYGEPFADSSALPTWLICQAARRHVVVALTGDGGDEAFAGYDRYRAMHLAATMSPSRYLLTRLAAALVGPFAPLDERSRLRRLVRFSHGLPLPPALQYLEYRTIFHPHELPRLLTEDFAGPAAGQAVTEWFTQLYEPPEGQDFEDEVTYAQRHDLATYLPDDLLVKADIASMASSLELRSPMLDHHVVTLGLSLPVELKVTARRGKIALRRALGELLPPEVFGQPKRGFGVPLGRWLREDLLETVRETLLDRGFLDRGIIRPEAVAGLLNDHLSGRADHRHKLWALLVLGRWLAQQS